MGNNNNEGRMSLSLPSGRKAIIRSYDAYIADAMGDTALQEEGTALDKAISGLVEAIDGEKFPSFEEDRGGAIRAARGLLLNDYHFIIFMAAASFRDGFFEGKIPDGEGGSFDGHIDLLDNDGNPLEQFQPPPYPLGTDKKHEWEEAVPELDGQLVKFKMSLLDGAARARMLDDEMPNFNADLVSRNPAFYNQTKDMWIKYQPKARPPVWASRILSRKVKVIDPVIQFTGIFKNKGKKITRSLIGIPDFFLQDFT